MARMAPAPAQTPSTVFVRRPQLGHSPFSDRLGGLRKRALASAIVLALAAPATAQQLGAATASPPPEGVADGQSAGYTKGRYHELDALPKLDPKRKHTIEAVVDRLVISNNGDKEERRSARTRLTDSIETALKLAMYHTRRHKFISFFGSLC